jgi:hypothetical protein
LSELAVGQTRREQLRNHQKRGVKMKTRTSRRGSNQLRTTLLQLVFAFNLLLGPSGAQADQIACGQTITGTISSAGQTDTYGFEANAGETLDILVIV